MSKPARKPRLTPAARAALADDARSPHHLDPIVGVVGNLCPDLSAAARRRAAEMAEFMRDRAASFESCTGRDLLAAGFAAAEIEAVHALAAEAAATLDATPLPRDAVSPFSLQDAAVLRRFAAARRPAAAAAFA